MYGIIILGLSLNPSPSQSHFLCCNYCCFSNWSLVSVEIKEERDAEDFDGLKFGGFTETAT